LKIQDLKFNSRPASWCNLKLLAQNQCPQVSFSAHPLPAFSGTHGNLRLLNVGEGFKSWQSNDDQIGQHFPHTHLFPIHFLTASCANMVNFQDPQTIAREISAYAFRSGRWTFQPNSPLPLLNSRTHKPPSRFPWYIYVSLRDLQCFPPARLLFDHSNTMLHI
jgi:hypothetical protein